MPARVCVPTSAATCAGAADQQCSWVIILPLQLLLCNADEVVIGYTSLSVATELDLEQICAAVWCALLFTFLSCTGPFLSSLVK
jgi:hypothetical protein